MKGTEKDDQVAPNTASDNYGYLALEYAALNGGYNEICEQLLQKMTPEAINAADNPGNTALHAAAIGAPGYAPNNTDAELYGNTDDADLDID